MLWVHAVTGNHEPAENTVSGHDEGRVWTFVKGGEELTVEQWVEGETVVVTLTRADETGAETVRAYEFPNQSAGDQFHANLDTSLLAFGWTFIGHLPERRAHHDRRQSLRKSDRRRWWTDGDTFLDFLE